MWDLSQCRRGGQFIVPGSKLGRMGDGVGFIKARFAQARTSGKRMGFDEAAELLQEVGKSGYTPAEKAALLEKLRTEREALEPDVARWLDGFVAKQVPRMVAPAGFEGAPIASGMQQPHLMPLDADDGAKYRSLDGWVFVEGVKPGDAVQGKLGDCFLMATLNAVIAMRPELIEKAFHINEDRTLSVMFYDKVERPDGTPGPESFVPHPEVIDGDLPTNKSWFEDPHKLYGYSKDASELWSGLLEKAYAQRESGYLFITGGVPAHAMEAVLGASVGSLPGGVPPKVLEKTISMALSQRKVIVASSLNKSGVFEHGVWGKHAYAVVDSRPNKNGEPCVVLRNPAGGNDLLVPYTDVAKVVNYFDVEV
jgi:hypothetical protein